MVGETGPATFGQLLRSYRLAVGLTQQALADRAGVSRRGIDDLERGARRAPYRDTVQRLVSALGLREHEAAHLEAAVARSRGRSVVMEPRDPDIRDGGTLPARLPIPLTSLVGREREVTALGELLRRDDVRLVTITGAGGIGKTRLAQQVGMDLRDAFADGVWYVRLARLTDSVLVMPTIAQAFDLKEHGATVLVEQLHRHLQDKQALLVLDNFEHVAQAARAVGALLEDCPGVSALVTSRVPLHIRGEYAYALRPLAIPDLDKGQSAEHLAQYAAIALFLERAQAVQAESTMTPDAVPVVAEICRRLDGLPLAIELAAAHSRLLSPPALLERLKRGLSLLSDVRRDLDERQQTMRNTLAWSYDLLTPEEQCLFRRLAVFVGGCTPEIAEAVCAAPEGAEPLGIDVLGGLESLIDQHLVLQREETGESRFGMLHVIREFAREQLEASGELGVLQQAHFVTYLRLV
jgi:predicted ATPase/transcriptional regulator with XRE-family HTH domain